MKEILLINPNTSRATTDMMVSIARQDLPGGYVVRGLTAEQGVPMIVEPRALEMAGHQVLKLWRQHGRHAAGVVVGAFGDPGLDALRHEAAVPATGLCEASVLEAARGGRRFGIATVTPELAEPIHGIVAGLGLSSAYTGIRLTPGDPQALAADPERLENMLAQAVIDCIELDGAQAVVIGGGPLGQAATGLARRFDVPIIAPIPSAMRRLADMLGE